MKKITTTLLIALSTISFSQITQAKNAQFGSDYTRINEKSCKTVESHDNEANYYRQKCPAVKGYALEAEGMDLREWLNVKSGNKTVSYRNMNFSNFGQTAEWRYHPEKVNGKTQKVYHALIYRMFEAKRNEKTGDFYPQSQDKQSLVVVRLNKDQSCVLGVIPASKTMNTQARKLADNLSAKCPASLNQNNN